MIPPQCPRCHKLMQLRLRYRRWKHEHLAFICDQCGHETIVDSEPPPEPIYTRYSK